MTAKHQLQNPYKAFRTAKDAFNRLPVISFSRPDSLTRRGDEIIARWGLSVPVASCMNDWYLKEEFVSLVRSLLPDADITRVQWDRRTRQVRIRFKMLDDEFTAWLRSLPADCHPVVRDNLTDEEFDGVAFCDECGVQSSCPDDMVFVEELSRAVSLCSVHYRARYEQEDDDER